MLRTLVEKATLCGAVAFLVAAEVPANSTDARAIMQAMEDRDQGDLGTSRIEIVITDRAGRSRTRALQSRTIRFPEGRRTLMLFESPADVRNSGLLSIDYDDGAKSDDQWLYLPSLGKSTRIAGSDKSSSFMGTDLTYADMTKADTGDYDYTLVDGAAEVEGEPCWLIEARPRTDKAKEETGYLKSHVWVSKSKLVPLQSKAWVTAGKKLKYTKSQEWRQIDGIWVAHQVVVRTVSGSEVESTSTLTTSGVTFNVAEVTEADFSQRRLEQGL